jgi:hypothetical protein
MTTATTTEEPARVKTIHRNQNIHTPGTRDAALRRMARTSRWLLGGSVALTGVLTDVAANAFPGHAKPKTGSAKASASARSKHEPLHRPAAAPKTTTTKTAPPAATETTTPAPAEESAAPPAEERATPEPTQPPAAETAPVEEERSAPAPETHEAPPPEEPVVSGGS